MKISTTPVRRRTTTVAAVLAAVVSLLVSTVPGSPAAAADPVPPKAPRPYVNTTQCVRAQNAGARLKNGVSWAQTQLDYPAVWKLSNSGAGQTVAVIDTGVNRESAFGTRLAAGGDYVVPKDDGLDDCDGHGTVVAGLIAASPDPQSGFAGVAPQAKLITIRQSSSYYGAKNAKEGSPDRTAGTTASLALAIRFAVDKGATVINISEASCRAASQPPDLGEVAVVDAVNYALRRDVVVVVAAGNVDTSTNCKAQNRPGADPVTLPIPADIKGVLAVAAVDPSGQPAAFSLAGTWVGVAAPGVNIVSTDPVKHSEGQINQFITDNGVSPIQGTSFAAPYVAGLVALVRARFHNLTAAEVIARIERTAQHPAAPGGRNDLVGYGMIDPTAALTAVLPGEAGATVTPRAGPAVLPVARTHPDRERAPRRVALIGSLILFAILLSGAIAVVTRRRRRESFAVRSARRAGAG